MFFTDGLRGNGPSKRFSGITSRDHCIFVVRNDMNGFTGVSEGDEHGRSKEES